MAETLKLSDIFISYSRKDKAFVQQLAQALAAEGQDVWIDWEDIPPTANWWNEIQAGIAGADNFIFVISPDSAQSEVCRRETDFAVDSGKRLVPLLHRDVLDPQQAALLHPNIHSHNWIFFRESDDFQGALETLKNALTTDLRHVQGHTRLLVKAREWESRSRDNSSLLQGSEIDEAEQWLAQSAGKKPAPTELHQAFIYASRQARSRRQRNLLATSLVALAVTAVLLVFAVVQSINLEETNQQLAVERDISEGNLQQARNTQSLFLTTLSDNERESGNGQTALLLALESLRYLSEGVYHVQSYTALTEAMLHPVNEIARLSTDDSQTELIGWNPQQTILLTASDDGSARLWSASGALLATLPHGTEGTIPQAQWSEDGGWLATWDADRLIVWRSDGGEIARMPHDGDQIERVLWRGDAQRLFTAAREADTDAFVLRLWGIDGSLLAERTISAALLPDTVFNPSWSRLIVADRDGFTVYDDQLMPLQAQAGQIGPDPVWNSTGDRFITAPSLERLPALWTADGVLLAELEEETGQGIAWNANESHVIAWGPDGAQVWTRDGRVLITEGFDPVAHAFWLPDNPNRYARVIPEDPRCPLGDVCRYRLSVTTLDGLNQVASFTYESELGSRSISLNPNNDLLIVNACEALEVWSLVGQGSQLAQIAIPEDQVSTCEGVWNSAGNYFLTQWGGNVGLWRGTGAPIATLEHEFPAAEAEWRADSRLIAVSSPAGEVQLWDTRATPILNFYYGGTSPFVIDDARARLAVAAPDGAVYLWRLNDPPPQRLDLTRWDGLVWNDDESRVLTWLDDSLFVWDAEGTLLANRDEGVPVTSAHFSDDGQRALIVANMAADCVGECVYRARVWDFASNTTPVTLTHDTQLAEAIWNRDETRIILETAPRPNCRNICTTNVFIYTADGVLLTEESLSNTDSVDAQIYAGRYIMTNARNNISKIYDMDGQILAEVLVNAPLRMLLLSADGQRAVTVTQSARAQVQLWDTDPQGWRVLADLSDVPDTLTGSNVQLSPDETRVLTVASAPRNCDPCDSAVFVWDLTTGEARLQLDHDQRISSAAYSPDGSRILSTTDGGSLILWDAESGEQQSVIPHDGAISDAFWSPTSERAVAIVDAERLTVWESSGTEAFSIDLEERIIDAAFSPDGAHIAIWTWDKNVYVYTVQGALASVLTHDALADAVWAADDVLFTLERDSGTLRLWSLAGEELALMAHTRPPTAFRLSDDGLHAITRSEDAGQRWIVNIPRLITAARDQVTRNLSPAERDRFFLPPVDDAWPLMDM